MSRTPKHHRKVDPDFCPPIKGEPVRRRHKEITFLLDTQLTLDGFTRIYQVNCEICHVHLETFTRSYQGEPDVPFILEVREFSLVPELFFDDRDGEWSVRYKGQDLSDLAAIHHSDEQVRELGNDAFLLNTTQL